MNAVGDPTALQCVLGFEIDTEDRIWILDQGQIGAAPAIPGAIKLVIWDSLQNVLIRSFPFPPAVASPSLSFLNDIVVDQTRNYAYISDCGNDFDPNRPLSDLKPGIVVYDYDTNSATRVLSQQPSVSINASFTFSINGVPVFRSSPVRTGVDGIALSCDGNTLYFCALSSEQLYSIDTSSLRQPSVSDAVLESRVVPLGNKGTPSDGLVADSDGGLFLTALTLSGVLYSAQPSQAPPLSLVTVASDPSTMQWPDTLAFDGMGVLYFVSNQLNNWNDGVVPTTVDNTTTNFRIWSVYVGVNSYLLGCSKASLAISIAAGVLGGAVLASILVCLAVEWRKRRARALNESSLNTALLQEEL